MTGYNNWPQTGIRQVVWVQTDQVPHHVRQDVQMSRRRPTSNTASLSPTALNQLRPVISTYQQSFRDIKVSADFHSHLLEYTVQD